MGVQNATGSKARGLNASEFGMLMEYGALPELLKRALGVPFGSEGGREVWDVASLKYWVAMGCPEDISWMDVHLPFGISDDNAPIHLSFGLACMSPRLLPIEEYTALFEKALHDHEYDINAKAHQERAFETVLSYINDEKELVEGAAAKRQVRDMIPKVEAIRKHAKRLTGLQFFILVKFRKFDISEEKDDKLRIHKASVEVAEAVMDEWLRPLTDKIGGTPWEAQFRRDMAWIDPRWLCLLPEQMMPLGNTTPDLHQTAEMLVAITKTSIKDWTLEREPEDPALLITKSYSDAMQAASVHRNVGNATGHGQDQVSIRDSINKMWICAQILATEGGKVFNPTLAPGDLARGGLMDAFCKAAFYVVATGGYYPPNKWT